MGREGKPWETVVRPAAVGDAPALASLRRRWRAEEDGTAAAAGPGFETRFVRWYADELDRGSRAWIAEVDDTPVGMLYMFVHERMPRPGRRLSRWGYVGNVFVVAEHRGAGVGRALLDRAVAFADDEELVRLVLNPSERSVPLYERVGFSSDTPLMVRGETRPTQAPTVSSNVRGRQM